LAEITEAISSVGTNIVHVNAGTVDNRYGLIDMTLEIKDTQHLEKIMNRIKGIEGVSQVERAGNRPKENRK